MPPPTKQDRDSDVPFHRTLLQQSSAENNVKSWLSRSLHASNGGNTSAEDVVHEEDDVEVNEEEGGLGYVAPADGLPKDRQSYSTNDKLRKQLLGKQSNQIKHQRTFQRHAADGLSASKPRPQVKPAKTTVSDDEAEGRTSSTRKSSKGTTITGSNRKAEKSAGGDTHDKSHSKKRPVSYLDEILAKRTKKERKT